MVQDKDKSQDHAAFVTNNLFLTAALITAGFELKALKGQLPHKADFVFNDGPKLEQTVQQFWSNRLRLPAFQLLQQLKATKDRLYEEARRHSI